MDGFHLGSYVAAGLLTVGAVLAWVFLPAHAAPASPDRNADETSAASSPTPVRSGPQ
jgi:hypothetical protein